MPTTVSPEAHEHERDANVHLPVVADVCRLLRTKTAFGTMQPGGPDWRTGESTTAVYWCLQTMETAGVDDGFAHPHRCREGRGCFVSASPTLAPA